MVRDYDEQKEEDAKNGKKRKMTQEHWYACHAASYGLQIRQRRPSKEVMEQAMKKKPAACKDGGGMDGDDVFQEVFGDLGQQVAPMAEEEEGEELTNNEAEEGEEEEEEVEKDGEEKEEDIV